MNERLPVDKLEQDILPPDMEIALSEYFADIAFDQRLLDMIEAEPTHIDLDVPLKTKEVLDEALFPHNSADDTEDDSEQEVPVTDFRVRGTMDIAPGSLGFALTFHSQVGEPSIIHLESESTGPVYLFDDDSTDLRELSVSELTDFSLRVADISEADRRALLSALEGRGLFQFRTTISDLWEKLAIRSGDITKNTKIHQDMPSDDTSIKKRANIEYEEVEKQSSSKITVTLEYVIQYLELDAEEAYTLVLSYENNDQAAIEQKADKYIVSGISGLELTSARASHRLLGKKKPLDVQDPLIMQLFVNTFDGLLTA
jgi:hypothetical protein